MLQIKRFIDKVAVAESKQTKDLVLPMADARGLRDEMSKLLSDLYDLSQTQNAAKENEIVQVEIKGGSFQ
jgi:hypothetical protein